MERYLGLGFSNDCDDCNKIGNAWQSNGRSAYALQTNTYLNNAIITDERLTIISRVMGVCYCSSYDVQDMTEVK